MTIRVGDRLTTGSDRVLDYPATILSRLDGHTLTAIAVGQGSVVLRNGSGDYTVQVRVLRATTQ